MSTTVKTELEVKNVTLLKPRKNDDGTTSNLLAYANVHLLDGKFRVNGLRVINGKNGPFVAMPGKAKKKDGQPVVDEHGNAQYDDTFHALDRDSHNVLQTAVLNAFLAAKAQENAKAAVADPK